MYDSMKKTRREVLSTLAASGLLLIACDDGADPRGAPPDADMPDAEAQDAMLAGDSALQDGGLPDGSPADASLADQTVADAQIPDMTVVEGWASGGTASIRDKANYPDPFANAAVPACVLVATTTAGPCSTATHLDREDVSEGWTGLPMRLGIRVVDTDCQPLAGAMVRIWHTNAGGSYSGQTPRNDFCLLDQDYARDDFFRGERTTSDDGVVWFDSCLPGWYPGRAIHVHFDVVQGGRSTRISQLTFADDVIAPIFASHPDYRARGPADTSVATDGVFNDLSIAELAKLTLDVARMDDGVMLASTTIAIA